MKQEELDAQVLSFCNQLNYLESRRNAYFADFNNAKEHLAKNYIGAKRIDELGESYYKHRAEATLEIINELTLVMSKMKAVQEEYYKLAIKTITVD